MKGLIFIIMIALLSVFAFVDDVEAAIAVYNFSTANGKSAVINQNLFNKNSTAMTIPPAFTTGWDGVNGSGACYTGLGASDNIYCETVSTADETFLRANFTIAETPSTINWIAVYIEQQEFPQTTNNEECQNLVANFTNGAWTQTTDTTETEVTRMMNFTTNAQALNIIDASGNLSVMSAGELFESTDGCRIDWFNVTVDYTPAGATEKRTATNAITLTPNSPALISFNRRLTNGLDLSETRESIQALTRASTSSFTLTAPNQRSAIVGRTSTASFLTTDRVGSIFINIRNAVNGLDLSETMSSLIMYLRQTTQSIDLTERIAALSSYIRQITQAFDLAETVTTFAIRLAQITQSIDLADSISTFTTRVFQITQSFDLAESVTRLASFARSITQSFSLTERITNTVIVPLISRTSTLSITVADRISSISSYTRYLTNSFDLTDATQALIIRVMAITQSFDLAESVTRLASFARSITQSLDITDAMTRLASFARSITQSIDLADSISTFTTRLAQITQSIDLADSISTFTTRVFQITQSLDITDAMTRLASFTRSLTQSIDLSETAQRLASFIRAVSQSLSITERITAAALQSFPRSVTQSLDITDNITYLLANIRLNTIEIGLTETTSNLVSFIRSLTNSINLTNSIMAFVTRLYSITQSIDLADSISTFTTRVFQITQSLDITDAMTRLASFARSITQSIDLAESIQAFMRIPRNITQSFDLTEAVQTFLRLPRQITQSLDITDAMTRLASFTRSLTQSIDLSETAQRLASFIRAVSQSLSITERITAVASVITNISSTLAIDLTDNIVTLLTNVRLATNAMDFTEISQRIISFSRNIQSSFSFEEISIRIATVLRSITDSFSIAEALQRLITYPRMITQSLDLDGITSRLSLFQRITSLQFLVTALASPSFKTVSATFTVPTASVVQGEFVEFDINVKNTGNVDLNASTGVEIYNSTGSLVKTVNSTNTSLIQGQSKTIITFTNSINLSADNYRAEGRVLFDGRATINMTKFFNVSSAANVLIGNYTNTSISFAVDTPTLIIANTSSTTTSNISIVLNSSQEGGIGVAEFSSVVNQTISGQSKLKFIHITASPNITNNLRWYWLNISYTDAEIASAGVTESGLKIWFYNTTTSSWQQESSTGVETSTNYVWANVSHFSLFGIYSTSSAPSGPAPSGGAGGGGGTISALPTVKVEFVGWSVLREISAGQSAVEGIVVKNKEGTKLTDVHVEVSGVPAEWVSVVPKSLNLEAHETKGFNLIITVPKNTEPGDYKMLVTLKNSQVEDSNFMIVRVKNYPVTYDKPIVTRTVQLDYELNKSKIILDVDNPVKYHQLVQVQEEIPKKLATSAADVEFNPYPDEILRDDPLVQWNLKDLKVNDTRELQYVTKGILSEFTTYIYLPLKELKIIETKIPTGLKIAEIKISPLYSGKSSVGRLVIENTGEAPKKLEFTMQLPSGWKMDPQKIEAVIQPHERKEFKFSIMVPEDALPGDYIGTSVVNWGEDVFISESVLSIAPIAGATVIIIIGAIAIVVLAAYLIKSRRQERPLAAKFRKIASGIRGSG